MTSKGEKIAAYRRMKAELQDFNNLPLPKPSSATERIFGIILDTTRLTVELADAEIDSICDMARDLYEDSDNRTRTSTFRFMKKLATIFVTEQNSHLNVLRGPTFAKLLSFYFKAIFPLSRDSKHCSEAAEHVAKYSNSGNAYRNYVLNILRTEWLAEIRVVVCDKKTVKNLLFIVSEKIRNDITDDRSWPGTTVFLDNVFGTHDSCGVVIRICHVLNCLLQGNGLSRGTLQRTSIIEHILSHVSPSSTSKKCWEAVAEFFEMAFSFSDIELRNFLVDRGVLPGLKEMLRRVDHRPIIVIHLLSVVGAACRDPEHIDSILDEDLIARVLKFVEDTRPEAGIREKAGEAFDAFLATATAEHVLHASNGSLITNLLTLLRSKHKFVLLKALKWLYVLIQIVESQRDPRTLSTFQSLVRQWQGHHTLMSLFSNSDTNIGQAALIVDTRLRDAPRRLLTADEAARRRTDDQFMHETLPFI